MTTQIQVKHTIIHVWTYSEVGLESVAQQIQVKHTIIHFRMYSGGG